MSLSLLRQLDWKTSSRKASLGNHWRIYLCSLIFVFVTYPILHFLYPNTFFFFKLWAAGVAGLFTGSIIGGFWQLSDSHRRTVTSGRLLLLLALVMGLLIVEASSLVSDLAAQESELKKVRSLHANQIVDVSLNIEGKPPIRIKEPQSISMLVSSAQQAELFYPSHEGSAYEFQIKISFGDGTTLNYDGRVPERHRNDFSIRYRMSEIIFPKGGQWLESVSKNAS